MLLKVKYRSIKKYIKLHSGFTYSEFIREVKNKFGLPDATQLDIFDETDTAVEEDILLELLEANPDMCLTVCDSISDEELSPLDHSTPSSLTDTISLSSSDSDLRELGIPTGRNRSSKEDTSSSATKASMSEAAKEMVEKALLKKPGGEYILEEYKSENSLMHRTRRQLVNILASDITEKHGRIPSRQQKKYALGIITLFPSLKDPFSPKGYVSFTTLLRKQHQIYRKGLWHCSFHYKIITEHFYDGEKGTGYLAWRLKTISRTSGKRPRRRSANTLPQQLDGDACREAISFLVHSPDEASVFQKMKMTFQHRQDLVHDPQRSTDVFKTFPRFLDVKGLVNQDFLLLFGAETASKMLEKWDTSFKPKVIKEAKKLTQTTELCRLLKSAEKLAENYETDWDSDIASLLLLLYLLPPTAGRKRTKISPSDAVDKMVHFHKLILCQATSSLGAFDELFKSHYVFNMSYDESLVHFYTFLQTTVYNIDVTTTDESPRVRELRAKLLNDT
ncbi:hypothetical protein Q7C36_011928 [Tachysurus vachellii]|uniref:Uncharacterized protein n=1 Tax=Tachysurus vachellii TaxID=175792 RepID=A0AA88MV27_TACVA|nr:hypothetical protein Q7C36_011928 [Tachysurus vachellii]